MKPTLKSIYPDLMGLIATPKQELVANPYRQGGKEIAENFMEYA